MTGTSSSVVPLQRRFNPVPDAFQRDDLAIDEVWPGHFQRPAVHWDTLEQAWRVVILAEAGAGKTYELRAAARRLVDEDKSAFFIRLEDVAETFETAFEVGTAASFTDWERGTGEAWFFLDSVDEMRLADVRAFETALTVFADRVAGNRHRAHVYISSRPYAWRPVVDRALIERLLPFASSERSSGFGEAPGSVEVQTSASGAAFQLFLLGELSEADVALYADFRGVEDVEEFKAGVRRAGLDALLRRPFDLEDLLAAWRIEHALPSRLGVLQSTIRRQIEAALQPTHPGTDVGRALEAVRLLAACAMLTDGPNIRLPDRAGDGMDPSVLLTEWSREQLEPLLSCGIFGDPIYGAVRFRHREIRELLAAEWFASWSETAGNRQALARLLFRSRYGLEFIPLRLRPLFPWLVLFDEDSRARAFGIAPEVALEGGDVGRLSVSIRVELLERLLEQMHQPGSTFRGLDYQQIQRLAHPTLGDEVKRLIRLHQVNDDAIFILARIVIQGSIQGAASLLSPIAVDTSRGIWARLVSAAAVMAMGTRQEAHDLWTALLRGKAEIPRCLFAEILEHSPADARAVQTALAGIDKLPERNEHEVDNVPSGLHQFIDRLPADADADGRQPLLSLLKGLHGLLDREPWIERRDCHVSAEFRWLMPAALHCVERLIEARSPAAFDDVALAILASAPVLSIYRSADFNERKSALQRTVPEWIELNDALFWWTVERRRARPETLYPRAPEDWAATWTGHFWAFDEASFDRTVAWIKDRASVADRRIALARAHRTFEENGQPSGWIARLEAAVAGEPELEDRLNERLHASDKPEMAAYRLQEEKRLKKMRAQERKAARDRRNLVRRLAESPEDIRNPPALPIDGVSRGQWLLLQTLEQEGVRTSRSHPIDWCALAPEFGHEVAEAFRDAAIRKWRDLTPALRSEGDPGDQVSGGLLFAMAGLEIDAGWDGTGLTKLPEAEVRQALRYAPRELNGFPRWLEPLFQVRADLVHAFIWQELEWELRNSPADQPLHYILHDIVFYAPWIHQALAPTIVRWVSDHHAPNIDSLRHLRQIVLGGGTSASTVAGLARAKINDAATPISQLPTYHAMFVDAEPAIGVPLVERALNALPFDRAKPFAEEFLVALVGNHRQPTASFGNYRTPTYLKMLYVLSFGYIRSADDIERAGGGVYSPERRDHAQEARSILLSMLTDIPGELSYRAILELAEIHPEPGYRTWMLVKARERAIADADLSPLTTRDVAQLAERLRRTAAAHRTAHA